MYTPSGFPGVGFPADFFQHFTRLCGPCKGNQERETVDNFTCGHSLPRHRPLMSQRALSGWRWPNSFLGDPDCLIEVVVRKFGVENFMAVVLVLGEVRRFDAAKDIAICGRRGFIFRDCI